MHIKRKTIPKFWPIQRTGTKYMTVATHEKNSAIPLMIVARDMLKIVKTRKELLFLLKEKKIMINGKAVNDKGYPLMLFDCLSFPSIKKYYRIGLEKRKFTLQEISEQESKQKIYKVNSRKILPGKKVQLNLSSGKNILSSEKINVGDFISLNSENKILKVTSLGKDSEVLIIKGKHMGKEGKIKEVKKEGEATMAEISTKEGILKINLENIFAKP